METPFFSLILCSVDRVRECEEFLESLARQNNPPSFEVLLIDQNTDGKLDALTAHYQTRFPLRRFSSPRGLSRARNVGLREARGVYCALPDDDCLYPATLLHDAAGLLRDKDYDILSCRSTDAAGRLSGGFMSGAELRITRRNVWRTVISYSFFFRRSALAKPFDETLGVGSGTPFGSGEETDFVLHMLEAGARGHYLPSLHVEHPLFTGPWRAERAKGYGRGFGRVLRKHRYGMIALLYYASIQFARAGQFALSNPRRARFHFQMACGRLHGYFMRASANR